MCTSPRRLNQPDRNSQFVMQFLSKYNPYSRKVTYIFGRTDNPFTSTVILFFFVGQLMLYMKQTYFGIICIFHYFRFTQHTGFPLHLRIMGYGKLHVRLSCTKPDFTDQYITYSNDIFSSNCQGVIV